MSHPLHQYLAAIGVVFFLYAMIASFVLRYCIDDEKVRRAEKPSALFRAGIPPRSMLTRVGLRVWWSRAVAIVAAVLFVILAASLEKKEPIQASETTRGK